MVHASIPFRTPSEPPSTLALTIAIELVLTNALCTTIAFYTNSKPPTTHGGGHIVAGIILTVTMFTGGAAFLSEIIHSIRPGMNKSVLAVIFGTIWAAAAASVTYIATKYGFAVWWWTALAWLIGTPLFFLILCLLGHFRVLGWGFHGPIPARSKV